MGCVKSKPGDALETNKKPPQTDEGHLAFDKTPSLAKMESTAADQTPIA